MKVKDAFQKLLDDAKALGIGEDIVMDIFEDKHGVAKHKVTPEKEKQILGFSPSECQFK